MSAKKTLISRSELRKHDLIGDCWIEIEGSVYDVSEWMGKHPGGERILESIGGRDASLPFMLNHKKWVAKKYLSSMYIGKLEKKISPSKYDNLTKDFQILYKSLQDKGWFKTDYKYYCKKFSVLISMLCASFFLFYLSRYYNTAAFAILASIIIGMFWQQIAFIGHDLGHNGVTHNLFADKVIGIICGNFGQGISIGWWKYTHNVHHVRTNDLAFDPDIQHMPFISVSRKYLNNFFSKFHQRILPSQSYISSICIRYQHYHWFFTIMLSRVFVYIQSLIFVFYIQPFGYNGNNVSLLYIISEQISLVSYHIWVFLLFYYNTSNPLLYHFISYFIAGILHVQIILNHFPCPVFEDIDNNNFIVHQLKSSMAISSTIFTHWFYGGLQFQVEHHLFPMMPRHNLRKVKPFILELCYKYDIPYLENSFLGALKDIFYVLKDVSKHIN